MRPPMPFLDSLAAYRRGLALPALSINWGVLVPDWSGRPRRYGALQRPPWGGRDRTRRGLAAAGAALASSRPQRGCASHGLADVPARTAPTAYLQQMLPSRTSAHASPTTTSAANWIAVPAGTPRVVTRHGTTTAQPGPGAGASPRVGRRSRLLHLGHGLADLGGIT